MQRLFDLLFSLLAVVALSPLLLAVTVILRLTGEGEILYRQPRVGRAGKEFGVLKFATMLKESPNLGTGSITVSNDPRVLPVGRILRKTKVNELPQLFNVIFGDMSLIGPRPLTRDSYSAYPTHVRAVIGELRPGLSGIGSIVFRNEEALLSNCEHPRRFHREVITPYKGQLEVWYAERQGLAVYLMLILLTLWAVISPDSRLVWRAFPSLPKPPSELASVAA